LTNGRLISLIPEGNKVCSLGCVVQGSKLFLDHTVKTALYSSTIFP
jgi:hypothetical protein